MPYTTRHRRPKGDASPFCQDTPQVPLYCRVRFCTGPDLSSYDNATRVVTTDANATLLPAHAVTKIVSDQVRDIILTINLSVLCQMVSVVGVVTNILNLCVFVKQGLGDAINVTLAGLALADLSLVTFAIWLCICYNPLFNKLDLPFSPTQFVYLTAGLPRLSSARASSWILAFASVERCLCITKPLAFRTIITPKMSFVFIVGVYIVMAASVIPTYYTSRLVWSFDAALNKSVVSLGFTSDRFAVDNVAFAVGVFLSVASFVSVAVCTAILTWSLKEKTKWRETNATSAKNLNQTPLVSYRNKRVGKMILHHFRFLYRLLHSKHHQPAGHVPGPRVHQERRPVQRQPGLVVVRESLRVHQRHCQHRHLLQDELQVQNTLKCMFKITEPSENYELRHA
ncbi:hypothetical protein Btru_047888 [Bulinus truncatus]|nr:hypothetical protein Btru_047888 [Bulinus truncatus]